MSPIKQEENSLAAKVNDSSGQPAKESQQPTSEESSSDLNSNSCPNKKPSTDDVQNSNSSSQDSLNSKSEPKKPFDSQQEELVFDLKWTTKNELVSHLNEFSAFLLTHDGKNKSDGLKERMVKKNSELLSILASLPLKSTKRKCTELVDNDASNKLIAILSWSSRTAIVNHLLTRVGYGLLDDLIISKETQLSLISQNNKMIALLLNLPIDARMFFKGSIDSDTNEPDAKKQKANDAALRLFKDQIDEQMVQFRKEIQDIKDVVKSKGAVMTGLKSEIGRMKSELNNKIDQLNIERSETTFEYELTGLTEFFKADNDRYSDVFFCRGLPFSINVEFKKKDDQPKSLGFYLYCHQNDPIKWSCSTNYKLKLMSFLPNVPEKVKEFNHVFSKSTGFGNSKFIQLSDLMNEENGYVRDNAIKLVCQLKADKVIRPK